MTSDFNLQEYVSLRLDALDEKLCDNLDALKHFLEERDTRYEDRFIFQEKAILKAENYQSIYNTNHNDLMRQISEQAKYFMSHAEYNAAHQNLIERIDRLQKDIQQLREVQSTMAGKEIKGLADQARNQWLIGVIIGVISVSFSIGAFVLLNVVVK